MKEHHLWTDRETEQERHIAKTEQTGCECVGASAETTFEERAKPKETRNDDEQTEGQSIQQRPKTHNIDIVLKWAFSV